MERKNCEKMSELREFDSLNLKLNCKFMIKNSLKKLNNSSDPGLIIQQI